MQRRFADARGRRTTTLLDPQTVRLLLLIFRA